MAMTMLSTRTGMFAKVPLVCKTDDCPYAEVCQLLAYDMAPLGEYCPLETAQVELRAQEYNRDFELASASFTDKVLLNNIITLDIMLERCMALLAKEQTPVIDVVIGVADNGEEIRQPAVSKAWEAYERILKRRNEMMQLMNATRKDKKDLGAGDGKKTFMEQIAEVVSQSDFKKVEERPAHLRGEK